MVPRVEDEEPEYEARGHSDEAPLSVSQLNWVVKNIVEQSVPKVWVEGEVSDVSRPSSGHIYFTLKDEDAQIRAVIWRSAADRMRFKIKDGMSLLCCGAVEVYAPRGTYQIIVQQARPQGMGELQLAFQQLYQKLSAQGLFEASRKRPLPKFPRRIGFVTSPSGAAIYDFLEAANALWNDLEVIIIPARVQGEQASQEIARGIRAAHKVQPRLDVLIVGRGGGSMEDLWSFNEEVVVRAIAASQIPTVSAVGHEVDVTLSDLAADSRALTPTHAAHLLLPNRQEVQRRISQLEIRARRSVENRVEKIRDRLEHFTQRSIFARPHSIHQMRRQQIDELESKSAAAIRRLVAQRREKIASLARAAEALSPLGVLHRGYSVTKLSQDGSVVLLATQVKPGDAIETLVAQGRMISKVEEVHTE